MDHIVHAIPPVYDENSRVLILGTIPSPKSRQMGFFYGHPQNPFWKVMAALLEEETPMGIEERRAFLIRHHIALWDVLASCDIQGASDSSIQNPVVNDFTPIFQQAAIRQVFTTGKTGTKLYQKLTGHQSIYLPSTSPANCAMKWDALLDAYHVVLPYLKEANGQKSSTDVEKG